MAGPRNWPRIWQAKRSAGPRWRQRLDSRNETAAAVFRSQPSNGRSDRSSHLVDELADALDPYPRGVAGLQELPARGADTGRRPGENDIAGIEGDPRRQV